MNEWMYLIPINGKTDGAQKRKTKQKSVRH